MIVIEIKMSNRSQKQINKYNWFIIAFLLLKSLDNIKVGEQI